MRTLGIGMFQGKAVCAWVFRSSPGDEDLLVHDINNLGVLAEVVVVIGGCNNGGPTGGGNLGALDVMGCPF